MQIGRGVRGATGNKQIHGQQAVQARGGSGLPFKGQPLSGQLTHGNDHFRGRHGFVCLKRCRFHVDGNGASDDDSVGMTR